MLKNHFKLVWRSLQKNRTTSLINLSGLTIGLTTVFLIGLYVINEFHTDANLPHQDRTYRVLRLADLNGEAYRIGMTSAPFAPALAEDFPNEIEESLRVLPATNLVELEEDRYQENRYLYADPNFLTFFDFPLIAGDEQTALTNPNTVVLTLETARKYFGSEFDAVGKVLRIDNDYDAVVTGVLAEIETPLHFDFDLVESTAMFENNEGWHMWWNNSMSTYIRLIPGTRADYLEQQLPAFMDKYFAEDFERNGNRIDLTLQPLSKVYFDADIRYETVRHGNLRTVQLFLIAAILLIVIACFNYVNLSTAKAVERSTEVGIYKALGAGRKRIMFQMMGESLLLSAISVVAAVTLTYLVIPVFESTFDVSLPFIWSPFEFVLILAGIILILSILAGLYPGWLLSSFNIIPALKKNAQVGGHALSSLRRVLVVFQFVLSIALLGSTQVIHQQLKYLQDKDLGFDRDQVILVYAGNPDIYDQRDVFKEMLKQEPGVESVTNATGYPGGFHDVSTVEFSSLDQRLRMRTAFVDFDYVQTYGLQLLTGRAFSSDFATDSTDVLILNERAVAEMGLTPEEVMGHQGRLPMFDDHPRRVVGIIEDYHFSSLHDAIEPLVISTSFGGRTIGIKAQAGRIPEVLAATEEAWNTLAPAYPFTFAFLDDRLNNLYEGEIRQGNIFGLFAGIAIFIACLGMFGLAAFAASLRTKEIGIRKVLGASVTHIVSLLSRDYLMQVIIAILVATPISYILMGQWLEGFAYRVELNPVTFIVVGLLAILLVLATVSIQSVRSAIMNPVRALRDE